jgi:hypothetical protein
MSALLIGKRSFAFAVPDKTTARKGSAAVVKNRRFIMSFYLLFQRSRDGRR